MTETVGKRLNHFDIDLFVVKLGQGSNPPASQVCKKHAGESDGVLIDQSVITALCTKIGSLATYSNLQRPHQCALGRI